jgi:Mg2+ and Co2+ transporter CorA
LKQIKEEGKMASDELKIVLEDVKEKFDTVIEGYNLLSGKIDRLAKQNEAEHQQLQTEIMGLKGDLNEHRSNTELHGGRKRKKAS